MITIGMLASTEPAMTMAGWPEEFAHLRAPLETASDAALAALPGGLVGGAIGLLVGAHKTENWVDVKLPRR